MHLFIMQLLRGDAEIFKKKIIFFAHEDIYRKIASSNMSRLEAHVGFFRLLMRGIFGPYVL